jgi:hypothetical protein
MAELSLKITDEKFSILKTRAESQGFNGVEAYLLDLVNQVVLQIRAETKVESDDLNLNEKKKDEGLDSKGDSNVGAQVDPEVDPDQAAKDVLKDLGYI